MLTLILTSVATVTHQTAVSFRQSGRENEGARPSEAWFDGNSRGL